MNRRIWWIVIGVGVVVGAAILIGVLATRDNSSTNKTEATNNLCASLKTLDTSVKNLTSLDPNTATKSQYQTDVTAVQNNWNQVKSDAQAVQNAPTGDLDSAWNSFSSAVKNVPNSASASDAVNAVSQSAKALSSAAESTQSQLSNC